MLAYREASRRRNTTAVNYLTAVGAAIGVVLLGRGSVPGPGVVPAEALNPSEVWREWQDRKLPIAWSERPASG